MKKKNLLIALMLTFVVGTAAAMSFNPAEEEFMLVCTSSNTVGIKMTNRGVYDIADDCPLSITFLANCYSGALPVADNYKFVTTAPGFSSTHIRSTSTWTGDCMDFPIDNATYDVILYALTYVHPMTGAKTWTEYATGTAYTEN